MPPVPSVCRILVVDDDDPFREVRTRVLAEDGYEVVGAHDGSEAVALLAQRPYDLVLSGLHMSHVDGPSLYESLRTRHRFPVRFTTKLPRVIFMTGNVAEHATFLRGTTDPILQKPFPLRVLPELAGVLLSSALGTRSAPRPRHAPRP